MIRSVDIDRNNEIDFKEFVHLMKSRISHDPDYELKLAFQMIDSDSSGTISIDELRSLMRKVNQHLTEEEVDAIMVECDADGNRELDFAEFKQLMVSETDLNVYQIASKLILANIQKSCIRPFKWNFTWDEKN